MKPPNGAVVIPFTPHDAKAFARALRTALEPYASLGHSQSLDVVARAVGLSDWNALAAEYRKPALGAPMPILRVYDSDRARQFYIDWLGFTIDFEHRFDPALPLFTGITHGETSLGLSEHHGDGTPGTVVWIPTRQLGAFRDRLIADSSEQLRPGIDSDAPGGPTMVVTDPFGNELRFCEPAEH